jgi:hypothetical protein
METRQLKKGEGGLTICPYCGEWLDYHFTDYNGSRDEIEYFDVCDKCDKMFKTTYEAVGWEEVENEN